MRRRPRLGCGSKYKASGSPSLAGTQTAGYRDNLRRMLFSAPTRCRATANASPSVVMDIEFPRLGLIRVEGFDHFLADVYGQMR